MRKFLSAVILILTCEKISQYCEILNFNKNGKPKVAQGLRFLIFLGGYDRIYDVQKIRYGQKIN